MSMIRHLVLSILANSAAIYGVAYVLPEDFRVKGGWLGFIIIGLTLGILNTLIKPILKLISLPFIILTLGLFLLVINMVILYLIEWLYDYPLVALGVGIEFLGGWVSLLFTALILGILNSISHWLVK